MNMNHIKYLVADDWYQYLVATHIKYADHPLVTNELQRHRGISPAFQATWPVWHLSQP
jgi:hypothetical protein